MIIILLFVFDFYVLTICTLNFQLQLFYNQISIGTIDFTIGDICTLNIDLITSVSILFHLKVKHYDYELEENKPSQFNNY